MALLDLRHAVRVLARQRLSTAATLATVALAIGTNTLIFTLVHDVLLRPLPLPGPDRLVRLQERHPRGLANLTGATFVDLHESMPGFATSSAFRTASGAFTTGGEPRQVTLTTSTDGFFYTLGVHAVAGRTFSPADFTAGAPPVVVLNTPLWRTAFASDPSIVGRIVSINAVKRQIVGVVDVPASVPGSADAWLPFASVSPLLANRRAHLFFVVARLDSGTSLASARQQLNAFTAHLPPAAASEDPGLALEATPLVDAVVRAAAPALRVLAAAVVVLLLIASANVASLLLLQGASRAGELSTRIALGATRMVIVRQMLIESALLAIGGGGIGTLLAVWSLPPLVRLLPATLPRVTEIAPDSTTLALGLALSSVAALLFGVIPAVRASRTAPVDALRDRGRAAVRPWLRDGLVAVEVALTVVLLIAAGLLGRSLLAVRGVSNGFDPSGVTAVDLSLPAARYPGASEHAAFLHAVVEGLAVLPGVESAGATGAAPLSPTAATTMVPEGGRNDEALPADVVTATPSLFESLGMRLVRGRLFTTADVRGGAPIALVNETAARLFWPPGVDPIGRAITMKDWGAPYRAEVVGIVGDVHQAGPDRPVSPAVYYPASQFPETTLTETVLVRSALPADRTIGAVRDIVHRIDPDLPIGSSGTMGSRLSAHTAQRRLDLLLVAAFAGAALGLAAVGIYGVIGGAVAARTRELGIRIALGAPPGRIAWLTAISAARPVGVGALTGILGSVAAAPALRSLVFGVSTMDGLATVGALAAMALVAAAAVARPVWSAMRVDPIVALREP